MSVEDDDFICQFAHHALPDGRMQVRIQINTNAPVATFDGFPSETTGRQAIQLLSHFAFQLTSQTLVLNRFDDLAAVITTIRKALFENQYSGPDPEQPL